jgi:hypothetical protein
MRYLIIVFLLFCFYTTRAQYYSNDDDLNQTLITLDANARLDFGMFKSDISVNYNITEKKIDYLSAEIGMSAGDIYMTVELAKITQKSVDQVVEVYNVQKGKGWGVIAKELGIKPGSPEFHALKNNAKSKGKKAGKDKNGIEKEKGKG